MARKKASLKGKGVDILLGGSAEAEPEAAAAQPTPSEAVPNPFADAAAATADSQPNPFAEPETVAAPAAMDALSSEALGGQPPSPVSTSLPQEETPWLADEPLPVSEAAPAPSAPVSSGPVSVALPADPTLVKTPSLGGLIMSMPSIPSPESFEPKTELTQTGLKVVGVSETRQVVSEGEVLRRIGPERIANLGKRIDALYEDIAHGGLPEAQAGRALQYLRQARDKELEDQRQYDEAEYLVNVAQYLLARARNVREDSRNYGIPILIYGLVWLVAFGLGLFLELTGIVQSWLSTFIPSADAVPVVSAFFATIMAGGMGGVLGVLYSLFKHVAVRQDFDRQFVMWYIVQPFLGLLMGFIMHLFIVAGVFQLVNATGDAWRFLGLLVAVAAAFRQHYVYAWMERLLKWFDRGSTQASGEADKVVAPEAGPASELPPSSEPAGVG